MTMQVASKKIPFPVGHSASFKIEDMFRIRLRQICYFGEATIAGGE